MTKSALICFGHVGEDIALYYLYGDDVHPYRINYCDDPISSRARQLSRDIAEVPRASDRNVVNVASYMVTAPLIESRPCSGKRAHQQYLYGVVIGHRFVENQGYGRLDIACIGGRTEANVSDRINLARQWRMCDPWKPGFWQYGVKEWRNGLLTIDVSRLF